MLQLNSIVVSPFIRLVFNYPQYLDFPAEVRRLELHEVFRWRSLVYEEPGL